jgi:hypothetical protein
MGTPQMWEIAKEVSPKHFQLGIILGIEVSKCLNLLGSVNQMNLPCL